MSESGEIEKNVLETIKNITKNKYDKTLSSSKIEKKKYKVPDIPYSIQEVERSIRYYSRTCGEYEYARALEKYVNLLYLYKEKKIMNPPTYPSFIQYKYPEKRYKRPARYQNIGRTPTLPKKKKEEE